MAEREQLAVTDLSNYRDLRPQGSPALAPVSPPAGTVTFLLTDIEGSTQRWEANPSGMSAAVARHYEILDAAVAGHDGVRPVEQGEGDSMVAVFAHASDAAAAALEAQLAVASEPWPEAADINLRIALHTGEAQLRDGRYYVGPSIIRCARLRALAHGGQVLVSTTTADLLADGLPRNAALVPLGEHRLRSFRQPERIFQLTHPGLRAQFPALRSLQTQPTNLPVQLTSFIGRQAELVELSELMGRHRLVTLVGPGGSGKTRLAAEAAGEASERHPDGVWWVDLSTVADPERVPAALMAMMGLDAKCIDPVDRITAYLADRQVLVVLDNCEHVVVTAALLTERLLIGCPEVSVLATSREPLDVPGEVAWRVPPLTLPPTGAEVTADQLRAAEAVQLFCERAADARPGFAPDEAALRTVAAVVERLDGIPLAIELAAARIGMLSAERLLASLTDRFRVLTGGARTAQPRQQTLAASVEWSYDLLSDPERVLLGRLAVFTGAFDLDAAEAVAGGGSVDEGDVITLLPDLVKRSLVVFDGERYRLLQTIREFAAGRLDTTGEAHDIRTAHLRYYAGVAAAAATELDAGPQIATLNRLEAARENLMAAVDWALAISDHDAAMRLCSDMALFWQHHGWHSESLACLARVRSAAPPDPTLARADFLWAAGQLGLFTMDLPGGYGAVESRQAVEIAREIGAAQALGRALGMVHFVGSFMDPPSGADGLAEAQAAAEAAGDPYGRGAALAYGALAWIMGCDRPDLAAPCLDGLAAEASATGSPVWRIWHQLISGVAAWRAGRLAEAVAALTEAEALGWALGDPVLESWSAVWLSQALLASGNLTGAEEVMAHSATWMECSSIGRLEYAVSRRIGVAAARGDRAGRTALEPVAALLRSLGFPFLNLELAAWDGRLAVEEGDVPAAQAWLTEAEAIAETIGTPWYRVMVADLAGRVALAEGDPGAAEDAHHRALAICVEHGFQGAAAEALESLASIAGTDDRLAQAVRLLGAAHALRLETGQARWPVDTPAYDRTMATLAALGEDAFATAWKEGEALGLADAVAYAARFRAKPRKPSTGWSALTPTELEVVALATTGMTNAEIGQRLFITAGTAKVHLSNIYAKLGLTNRAQLAAAATARGIGSRPVGG